MKLNHEQIKIIRQFISKRGFTAIDLQLEILDHVACRLEEKMSANPSLGFSQALREAHYGFGVFGFSTMEDAMAKSLNKKYYGQIIQEGKKWVGFPSVILFAGFAFFLFNLYLSVSTTPLLIVMGSLNLVATIWIFVRYFRLQKRYRKMMVMQGTNAYVFIPAIVLQYWVHIDNHATQNWAWAALFTILVLGITFIFSATIRLQNFAIARCQRLETQYPMLWEA